MYYLFFFSALLQIKLIKNDYEKSYNLFDRPHFRNTISYTVFYCSLSLPILMLDIRKKEKENCL